MHQKSNKLKVTLMLVSTLLFAILASTVYANGEGSHGLQWKTPFMGVLTYGQVPNPDPQEGAFPPSNASGVLSAYLDHLRNKLFFSINYRDLQGEITKVHFHGPAVPGVANATHYFDICCEDGDPYPQIPEGTQGTFDGQTDRLIFSEIKDLMQGLWYINIHTDLYPTGELRGQVLPTGVHYFRYNP